MQRLGMAGLPPHARGKEFLFLVRVQRQGITPVCAGKSNIAVNFVFPAADHPRMRGEKDTSASTISATTGSPPHVRGKAEKLITLIAPSGITPARAGKSYI